MSGVEADIRCRIDALVESLRDDRQQSGELFEYVWAMMCVRRGLMHVVREVRSGDRTRIVVEEAGGKRRIVSRPRGLDGDMEALAIQALDRILTTSEKAS